MANLKRFFGARMKAATDLSYTDRHDESMNMLKELLWEPRLHLMYRIKANALLADGLDGSWNLREYYRTEAEDTYALFVSRLPDDYTGIDPRFDAEFKALRNALDDMAAEQLEDKPVYADGEQPPPIIIENIDDEVDLDFLINYDMGSDAEPSNELEQESSTEAPHANEQIHEESLESSEPKTTARSAALSQSEHLTSEGSEDSSVSNPMEESDHEEGGVSLAPYQLEDPQPTP